MAVPKLTVEARGLWKGESLLNLAYLPEDERVTASASELLVETDNQETFATLSYTWSHEGNPHQGKILISQSDKANTVELAWVDSWHQSASIMNLAGEVSDPGDFKAKGSFPAGDETWYWTIALTFQGAKLFLEMECISAAGEVDWAVRGTYERA